MSDNKLFSSPGLKITDDLPILLDVLPPELASLIKQDPDYHELLEIVLDLGREPEARFSERFEVLTDEVVSPTQLQYVVERISEFGGDNRAGIARTLHRISAIRSRTGNILGLTLRVGRAVFGTVEILRDLIESGRSILLLGKPGIGKTTMLREAARVLADDFKKRVVVVDTSNEIAGDGDVPHPGIGRARRMQVPSPERQHAVMIEAVENHMPEVIVIDEIGTTEEAAAARTIAERGVQLVATAHGITLENLLMNPTLSDLVGGIESVTLSDEEARRRGTQKTVLERRQSPTFEVLVEMIDPATVAIHAEVAHSVDLMLRGQKLNPEVRRRASTGSIEVVQEAADEDEFKDEGELGVDSGDGIAAERRPVRVFLYGISRNKVEKAAQELRVPVELVKAPEEAQAVFTLQSKFRRARATAGRTGNAQYFPLKSNTVAQAAQALKDIFQLEGGLREQEALKEAEDAVEYMVTHEDEAFELNPANAYIRRLQHNLADAYNLKSRSIGREPFRRVVIYREN